MSLYAEFADGSDTSYCSLGALQEITEGNRALQKAAESALLSQLREQGIPNNMNVPRWNDQEERTLDEVREAFLMAAKKLRNKE